MLGDGGEESRGWGKGGGIVGRRVGMGEEDEGMVERKQGMVGRNVGDGGEEGLTLLCLGHYMLHGYFRPYLLASEVKETMTTCAI